MKQYIGVDKQLPGSSVVYWIRRPHYVDVLTQGYVGISSQPVKERWTAHGRNSNGHNGILRNAINGGKDIVYEVLLVAQDREYCERIERLLRPSEYIGWNIAAGGGYPNNKVGGATNRLNHIKAKLADAHKASELWWRAEKIMLKRQAARMKREAREAYVPQTAPRKLSKRNSSGYTGVTWFKNYGMWRAQIMVDNKLKCLGYFRDVHEAAKAYEVARQAKIDALIAAK